MTTSWVETYRPRSFDEVVGNTKSVQILANLVAKNRSIPNLMICGPHGCGKTACVDILCESLIKENRESRVLRMNSFDERGIDVIRTTVMNFARGKVTTEVDPVVEKIVILDEADSMTSGAFQALRRIVDVYSKSTRFIIVCNDSTKIIEPIQSRCAILRFSRVDDDCICARLCQICYAVGAKYHSSGIDALALVADGDVRNAINNLSSTVSAFVEVTEDTVYKTCATPQPAMIAEIVEILKNKANFIFACKKLKEIYDDGHSPEDIVTVFFKTLLKLDLCEPRRLEIAKVIGLTQASVLNGASTYLQLTDMLWKISNIFCEGRLSNLRL